MRDPEGRKAFKQSAIWIAGTVDQAELICVEYMVRSLKAKKHITCEVFEEHLPLMSTLCPVMPPPGGFH